MGEATAISWTDATFNPWIGCTKVSAGCARCYAETQNSRWKYTTGWGPGKPRVRTSVNNWRGPLMWARNNVAAGVTRRVFCASLADVFDHEAPEEWRSDLWELIYKTGQIGGLEWLILTKRPEQIQDYMAAEFVTNPPDYMRIGVTVENQDNIKRVWKLHDYWPGKNFVSYEPALGPIVLPMRVDWLICGGESGAGCRPMDLQWARDVRDQCRAANTPFFMKQLGGHPNKRHDPAEWPADLRVQEFPTLEGVKP